MADSSQNHPSATLQDSLHDLINAFWQGQLSEIESGLSDFKFHQLPLARIKKVMKADEDVKVQRSFLVTKVYFSRSIRHCRRK